jgi:hypothetical protein
MKVFIFTWDRYDTLTTPMAFDKCKIPYTLLCHSEEQKQLFIRGGKINNKYILATGKPKGLANNRNVALDMMDDGEWALFFVDDLKKITELDDYDTRTEETIPVTIHNSTEWSRKFKREITTAEFMHRIQQSIDHAELYGVSLIAFAGFTNPLFLCDKYKFNTATDGRAWIVKKTDLRFDEKAQLIDDICWTVLNFKYGVMINQWVIPDCARYTKGGFGSIEDRIEQKKIEAAYLVKTYPKYVCYAEKTGWPSGTHVKIKNISGLKERIKKAGSTTILDFLKK